MIVDPRNTQNQENVVKCQSWDDLFNLTIDIAKLETHCSTLAIYKETIIPFNAKKGYGIAKFAPFPATTKQQNYEIQAYFFDPFNDPNIADEVLEDLYGDIFSTDDIEKYHNYKKFKLNDLYCIIFTDYNFKDSVEIKTQTTTTDKDVHSLSFGVVLNLK